MTFLLICRCANIGDCRYFHMTGFHVHGRADTDIGNIGISAHFSVSVSATQKSCGNSNIRQYWQYQHIGKGQYRHYANIAVSAHY